MTDYHQQYHDNTSNTTESSSSCKAYYVECSTSILQLFLDYALLKPISVRLTDELERDGQ